MVLITRINRNIVECKVSRARSLSLSMSCINRNIVECKVQSLYIARKRPRVLIETLWNVKQDSGILLLRSVRRINRNIVECKDWSEDLLPWC